jgi:DME family drug/metabolite transporter
VARSHQPNVPSVGIEPTTYGLEVRRSIHLSYEGALATLSAHMAMGYRAQVHSRLLIVFAALCFSTTGTAQELGPADASSLSVAAVRTVVGAIVLALFARFTRSSQQTTRPPRRELILAGVGMAVYAVAFFSAVRMTGIAVGTVVALGSAPLFAGIGSLAVFHNLPSRRWILTTIVAVSGMALIVLTGDQAQIDAVGVLAALAAGAGYALFALTSKSIMRDATNAAGAMASVFAIAAVLLSPILVLVDLAWIFSIGGVTVALWLGVVTVAFAYWAYSTGLRQVSPADATSLTIIEPVAATLLAAIVLREQPGFTAWIGIIVVITSLSIGSRTSR